MSVYSFYIFDRHTECIYSKRWTNFPHARNSAAAASGPNNNNTTNTNTLSHRELPLSTKQAAKASDDAKLIFGTIFSLRRMARQLGGAEDQFLSYRTGEYKLHYFETPSQLKFVLLTDTRVGNMRTVLYQIWATLYVEYVVKSPLAPTEHPGGVGVANELFEGGLEKFISAIFTPQPQ
ncbi:Transport particle subunit bet5 [Lecanosticta acicola]|uniref:Trafficking protein particle complex subunit n=1 Tax=Lecanosticta acicola TaxID=111012 RepID=A0AAI8YT00_9PEZI|nr:Transport particle subunit bet5 [Lecanosticta acicola]